MKKILIGQGRTAEIFLNDNNKIVKLFRQEISQNVVNLEYEINNHIERSGIPVPQTFQLIKINDRFGIVYEYIDGYSMLTKILIKPWTIISEAKRLTDLHLKIHSFTSDELPSQREKLIMDISKADLLTDNKKEIIIKYLKGLKDDKKICHGDLHPDNILIANNKPIIIDWLTSSRGNPEADVVRTSLLIKKGSAPPGTSKYMKLFIGIIRNVFYSVYIKRYIRKSRITKFELEKWKLPVAAARLSEELPVEERKRLIKVVEKGLKKIDPNNR